MASTLQSHLQRFTYWAAGGALVLALVLGLLAGRLATATIEGHVDEAGTGLGSGVAAIVANYVAERHGEANRLAASPDLVGAVAAAATTVTTRQLLKLPPVDLERMFAGTHQLGGDPALTAQLRTYQSRSGFTQVLLLEQHGLVVVASSSRASSRIRLTDDSLWQQAMRNGAGETDPVVDSATGEATVRYAVALRASAASRPVGVLEVVYPLRIAALLTGVQLSDSAYLQLVDRRGNLLYGPLQTEQREVPRERSLYDPDHSVRAESPSSQGPLLTVSVPVPRGELPANTAYYWVLFHESKALAYATARSIQRYVWLGTIASFVLALGLMVWVGQWLNRRFAAPVRAAGDVAARVAGGDLTVSGVTVGGRAKREAAVGEVGDLLSSVSSMVVALRKLVGAIRTAADEAAAMASEISASTQEMSASTQEMTSTCQVVTGQAAEQSQLVRAAAEDTGRILTIATTLAVGSDESVRRNAQLATVAKQHKELLDQSTAQLIALAQEVEKGAQEAEQLAKASAQIQKFVTQAKTVATQTNMLALNAAIEAARAGPQGRGFAVVADEVRKLASQAATSASETAEIVRGVLGRVQATRDGLVRLAAGGAAARQAAETAAQGLASVAAEAEANDVWGREIAKSAGDVRRLVDEIASRLTSVASGTEALVASIEEIAASSEEQSASTQEIASSANQLAEAADKLTEAVKTFRLIADDQPPVSQAAD